MSEGGQTTETELDPVRFLEYWAKHLSECASTSDWDRFRADCDDLIHDVFGLARKHVNRLFQVGDAVWAKRTIDNESEARRKLLVVGDCLIFATDCCLRELGNALLQQAAVSVKNGITAGSEDLLERLSELNSIQPVLLGNLGHQCARFFSTVLERPYPFPIPDTPRGPDRLFPDIDLFARGLRNAHDPGALTDVPGTDSGDSAPAIPLVPTSFIEDFGKDTDTDQPSALITAWQSVYSLDTFYIGGVLDLVLGTAANLAVRNENVDQLALAALNACIGISCSYNLDLRHLGLLRAQIHAKLGDFDSANQLAKWAIDLARSGPPLTSGDQHRLKVLTNLLPSASPLREIAHTPAPDRSLLQEVQSFVQTDILDPKRFESFAAHLRESTTPTAAIDISPIRNSLLTRFVQAKKSIGSGAKLVEAESGPDSLPAEPTNSKDKTTLTHTALQLNRLYRVLPLTDLDRFEALSAFVDCVGCFPKVIRDLTLRSELSTVISEGRALGERLLNSGPDLEGVTTLRLSRLYGHHAELHRALVQYSFIGRKKRRPVLESAVYWYRRALGASDNTLTRIYCCDRMARCQEQLGDCEGAVDSLRPVAVPTAGIHKLYARAVALRSADLQHQIGLSRVRKGDKESAWICFFEAEQSIAQAVSYLDPTDDIMKGACKTSGNASLHLRLVEMRIERLGIGDEDVPSPWEQLNRFIEASHCALLPGKAADEDGEVKLAKAVTRAAMRLRDAHCDPGSDELLERFKSSLRSPVAKLILALAQYCVTGIHNGDVEQILSDTFRFNPSEISPVLSLSPEALAALLSDDHSKRYVMQGVTRVKHREAANLGGEIRSLLRLKQILPATKGDTHLKRLLMEVYSTTGNEKEALDLANAIHDGNRDSSGWRAGTLVKKGHLLQAQGHLTEAAQAFLEAYETGGHLVQALVLAAVAFRLGGQLERAKECLSEILSDPDRDHKPEVTRSQWAKVIWAQAKASPGRADIDLEITDACRQLELVLGGNFGPGNRHDYGCIADLVEMLEHPAACSVMVRLVQNSEDVTFLYKLGLALGAPFHYVEHARRSFGRTFEQRELPAPFVEACIQRFASVLLRGNLERTLASLVMIILVQSYFRGGMAGWSFLQMAERVFDAIGSTDIASRRRRLSLLFVTNPQNILGEVVVAYVSKAMQVLSQLLEDAVTARAAVESSEFRTELRSFLSPATARNIRPASFQSADVVELEPLLREVIQSVQTDSRERLQSASQLQYEMSRKGLVSFESWQCLRQHVRLMLDVDNPKSPLRELGQCVASWRTKVFAFFNSVSISTEFSRIEDPDPRRVWKTAQSAVRDYLKLNDIEGAVKAAFVNSDAKLTVQFTVTVSKSHDLPPAARACIPLLTSLEEGFKQGIEKGAFHLKPAAVAAQLPKNEAELLRLAPSDWVAVMTHVFDARYSIVADWLFGPSRTARQAGRHPRMAFHDLSKLLPPIGTPCSAEQLANIRKHAAMATYTILRVLHQETHAAPPMMASLSAAIRRAGSYIVERCPDAQVEVTVEPDLMVAMDRNVLDSIVINLANNCVQAISRGQTERRVLIQAREDGSKAEIVFENPFDADFPGPSEGTGIGKGEIKYLVESVAGGRAVFPPSGSMISPYRVVVSLPIPRYDIAEKIVE